LPVGEGVVSFNTLEEAVEKTLDVEANYALHSKRASEIAIEYFDSDKVLRQLVEKATSN
jgi:hypothetical protein